MKQNAVIKWAVMAVAGLFLYLVVDAEPINTYISAVKEMPAYVADADEENALRRQIEAWGKEKEEPPIDARLDPVWKAIPGYNGRTVDVEASLKRMRESGRPGPEQLVFREVEPRVTLDQLGAQPIYRGNPQKPAISLMINVAWGNEYLDSILDTLDRYKVKTTFFLDGSWVRRNPELARKIAERGHEIGNHAYSHPDMSRLGSERIRQEIGMTQRIIEQTLGIKPTLFAPPSGAFNDNVVKIASREFQLKTIMWTADTVDWRNPPVDQMVNRVRRKLDRGVLVLMHPTASTAKGLAELIQAARDRGYTLTTVSEVISSKRLDLP